MNEPSRPRIAVSACLLGEQVRYDGGHKRDAFVLGRLDAYADLVPVCPEVELGLGTPREKIQLVRSGGEVRLLTTETQRDLTADMQRYAARRVADLAALQLSGFILKRSSPSCGLDHVRLLDGSVETRDGQGLFAAAVLAGLPSLPVIDERRLADCELRRTFLVSVFELHSRQQGRAVAVPEALLA